MAKYKDVRRNLSDKEDIPGAENVEEMLSHWTDEQLEHYDTSKGAYKDIAIRVKRERGIR